MPALRRHLSWVFPVAVLLLAALLRFWALSRPAELVFDELYYARDAISQLAHGSPTSWPDSDPDMSGSRAVAFGDEPAYAVHPPLGKWLIGLGVLLFGPDSALGWRFASALAGVAGVAVTMRLGWLMSRSLPIAWLAGLLLAVDGVHVTLSRVSLLDGFLAFFVLLGALFIWRDLTADAPSDSVRDMGSVRRNSAHTADGSHIPHRSAQPALRWHRPWLIAAGLAFGAAAAVKWSGLYPLAFFLIFITVHDVIVRWRIARAVAAPTPAGLSGAGLTADPDPTTAAESPVRQRPILRAAAQACITAAIALPTALLAYTASWAGWILRGGWGRGEGVPWPVALLEYHRSMFSWHSTLTAEHPFQAHPITWPLGLRPTAMYETRWTTSCPWNECVSGISPLPNLLVTWGGVAALIILLVLVLRGLGELRRARQSGIAVQAPRFAVLPPGPLLTATAFVWTGYLSGWLPWMLTVSRSAVFQFYTVVLTPFSALALALLIGVLCGERVQKTNGAASSLAMSAADRHERRSAAAIYVGAAVLIALLFLPVWSGMPVADWFWRLHMWLPGWE